MKIKSILTVMLLASLGIANLSCESESLDTVNDAELIKAIEEAPNKQSIEPEALPAMIPQTIGSEFAGNFVTSAELAPELGYKTVSRTDVPALLDESFTIYFDLDGDRLIRDRHHPNDVRDRCFRFVFPFSVTLQSGQTVTIENHNQFERLLAECRLNDNCFEFNYPIIVQTAPEEYLIIENNEELRRLYNTCETDRCFRIVFPITVTFEDGSVAEILNYRQFKRIIADCRLNGNCFEINFPITVQFGDHEFLTIENYAQLRRVYKRCDRGDSRPNDRD